MTVQRPKWLFSKSKINGWIYVLALAAFSCLVMPKYKRLHWSKRNKTKLEPTVLRRRRVSWVKKHCFLAIKLLSWGRQYYVLLAVATSGFAHSPRAFFQFLPIITENWLPRPFNRSGVAWNFGFRR
jgi:hypothetical protein